MATQFNVVHGDLGLVKEVTNSGADVADVTMPFGEIYMHWYIHPAWEWRVLQRGRRVDGYRGYYAQWLPINYDQLPEIVRVAHMCK